VLTRADLCWVSRAGRGARADRAGGVGGASRVGRCGVSAEIEAVQFAAPGASLADLGDGEGDSQAHLQARRDAKATPEPAAGPAGDFELEA
jgi:hypothetical protein